MARRDVEGRLTLVLKHRGSSFGQGRPLVFAWIGKPGSRNGYLWVGRGEDLATADYIMSLSPGQSRQLARFLTRINTKEGGEVGG